MVSVKGIFLEIWKVGPVKKNWTPQIISFGVQDHTSPPITFDGPTKPSLAIPAKPPSNNRCGVCPAGSSRQGAREEAAGAVEGARAACSLEEEEQEEEEQEEVMVIRPCTCRPASRSPFQERTSRFRRGNSA
jgi:hypothetical protein